jgi:transcriptional regulator with XRE-family HTH domain
MTLGEKLRYLREVEGTLLGLGRVMTQQELVQAIKKELGKSISQAYLSQIESGLRPHLSNTTRLMLARFFKVHPGYLVDDPEGYQDGLISELRVKEDRLDLWLINGAESFSRDPELQRALLTLAKQDNSRQALILIESILNTPGLSDRLQEVLQSSISIPSAKSSGSHQTSGTQGRKSK